MITRILFIVSLVLAVALAALTFVKENDYYSYKREETVNRADPTASCGPHEELALRAERDMCIIFSLQLLLASLLILTGLSALLKRRTPNMTPAR